MSDATPVRLMFPRWLRLWHWSNAILFLTLIVTGFSLHFAGVGQGGVGFKRAVQIHNLLGVALVVVYLFYLGSMAVTGHWRQYIPKRPLFRRIYNQVLYYIWGIFKGAHHPYEANVEARFNPIQQLAYIACVFAIFPLQILTGIALLFPDMAPPTVLGMNGLWPAAVGHSVVAYGSCAFLIVHLYLALTVGEEHTGVRAMVLGDRKPGATPHHAPAPSHGTPGE
jgi:thiosulfate reductase cytochrome b subunit